MDERRQNYWDKSHQKIVWCSLDLNIIKRLLEKTDIPHFKIKTAKDDFLFRF